MWIGGLRSIPGCTNASSPAIEPLANRFHDFVGWGTGARTRRWRVSSFQPALSVARRVYSSTIDHVSSRLPEISYIGFLSKRLQASGAPISSVRSLPREIRLGLVMKHFADRHGGVSRGTVAASGGDALRDIALPPNSRPGSSSPCRARRASPHDPRTSGGNAGRAMEAIPLRQAGDPRPGTFGSIPGSARWLDRDAWGSAMHARSGYSCHGTAVLHAEWTLCTGGCGTSALGAGPQG